MLTIYSWTGGLFQVQELTNEKWSYHLKFNYVLKWRGQIIKVVNSETPLRRFEEDPEVAERKKKKPKKPRGF